MVKRVLNYINKEKTNACRSNIVIYAVIFPILLALGMRIFLPNMQSMELTVAMDKNVDSKVIEEMKNYAKVELFDDIDALYHRVEKPDDVAGIIEENGIYRIVLEGNETGEAESIAKAIMNSILKEDMTTEFIYKNLDKTSSDIKVNMTSLLLLSALLISGLIIGLGIVDEKESKAIKGLAVTPLKLKELVLSHTLISVVLSLILGLLSLIIFEGIYIDYARVLIAIIVSSGIGVLLGYLIGIFADNLISAIAIIKSLMVFFVGIPIGSLFVPSKFQFVFIAFPNYWAFNLYRSIFGSQVIINNYFILCIITLFTSILFITLIIPKMKKTLKIY